MHAVQAMQAATESLGVSCTYHYKTTGFNLVLDVSCLYGNITTLYLTDTVLDVQCRPCKQCKYLYMTL